MNFDNDKLEKVKLALLSMQRHSWEQGVAMQAFLELGDMNTVITLAKEAAYRRLPDGRTAVMEDSTSATDPCSTGIGLHAAAICTNDTELIAAYQGLIDWTLKKAPANSQGILYHFTDKTQFWVDSMYMLPPFLADAGYYEECIRQINGYWSALYNPKKKMMSHMWDDIAGEYVREDIWGSGNGWTLAGIAHVIDLLPNEYAPERSSLQERVIALLNVVLSYMEEDGTFHDIIDNPLSFQEVNLSQMTAYTIYSGMTSGWLPCSYADRAAVLRQAAYRQIDAYGFLHNVCGAPQFDKSGISPEAQAFYLLMEASAQKYDEL